MSIDNEILVFEKVDIPNCVVKFDSLFKTFRHEIAKSTHLDYFITSQGLSFLNRFESLSVLNIRGGNKPLVFPDLKNLKNLNTVYINDQSQITELIGIDSSNSIEKLVIGNFTFGKPIHIENLKNVMQFFEIVRKSQKS